MVGASSGIGRQIAVELAQSGAEVLCLARRVELMEQMQEEQGAGKIIPCHVDVTTARSSDWNAILKEFVKSHGKISGGVYTAGITGVTSFRCWSDNLADKIMQTSYHGMLRFVQAASRKNIAEDGSSFVVFSSTAAHLGTQGLLFYASAKAAVQTAVKTIAKEIYQSGHRINSVSPGWVRTAMSESAEAVEFNVYDKIKDRLWLGEGTVDKVSGINFKNLGCECLARK